MAFHWRIRHKLILGLGVVILLIAALLGGTVYGLASFRTTTRAIEAKHQELEAAGRVKAEIDSIRQSAARARKEFGDESRGLHDGVAAARRRLAEYEELRATLQRGRVPRPEDNDVANTRAIFRSLNELDGMVTDGTGAQATVQRIGGAQPGLTENEPLRRKLASLEEMAGDLREAISKDLIDLGKETRRNFTTSLWMDGSVSVAGVVLLCYLLRFFYRWVFNPIRGLREGAQRVAGGDFDYRIEVHSGDELEDLADAFNDMTSRLRDTYRDLARQVNERSRQLVRSERLASVGFLAAGVAHEINNPLASIAFCSEALERRLATALAREPDGGEVVVKYLKMIQQEAFRCKAITQRLLEFSRGGERRREAADLAALIQGVLDMVHHLQNRKGKHIVFEPEGPVEAWVNAQEIKSVVLNLIVNALDSMDEGGTLVILLGRHGDSAEVVFEDTGCGMTEEVLENIFEPFFTRSRTGKGTGLGLSISHRVVSQHGGEIEATSPGPNRGSTFVVRLPLRPAEPVKEESLDHVAA